MWEREQLEAERDAAVQRSELLTRPIPPELASEVAFAAASYQAFFGAVSIISGRRQVLLVRIGTDIQETPRDQSLCNTTIQQPGEPLIVPDTMADPRFANLATVAGEPHIRFYAGVSIVDKDGYPLGALCVADRIPRPERFDPTNLLIRALEIERLLR